MVASVLLCSCYSFVGDRKVIAVQLLSVLNDFKHIAMWLLG